MGPLSIDDPFQYYHVPRFSGGNRNIQRGDFGPIPRGRGSIGGQRSRLNRLNLGDRSGNRRGDFVFYLLDVAEQLVPLGRR